MMKQRKNKSSFFNSRALQCAEFISPTDNRWDHVLSCCPHDVYHLPEYVRLSANYEQADPVAFYAECNGVTLMIPFLMKKIPEAFTGIDMLWDLKSPYGYPSPLLIGEPGSSELNEILEAFLGLGEEMGLVSAFVRFHPLYSAELAVFSGVGNVVHEGDCVIVELSHPEEKLSRQLRKNHKDNIRQLKQYGYVATIDEWEYFDSFLSIYHDTMDRLNAENFYKFSVEYFYELKNCLRDNIHLCTVLSPKNEVAAAGIFTCSGQIGHFLLSGTCRNFLDLSPSKLMYFEVQKWLKHNQCHCLNIGGGLGGKKDSLMHFKLGFSKSVMPYYTLRIIINDNIYNSLCEKVMVCNEHYCVSSTKFPDYSSYF